MSGCGADTVANDLLTSLNAGKDFNVDLPDFTGEDYSLPAKDGDIWANVPPRLTNADLTEQKINGKGTFDALMGGFNVHLKSEYEQNRISGSEYTKAYIALTEAAMGNATQFLLQKDQSYWQAITAQLQAQQAQVQLVTARVEMATAKARLQVLAMEAKNQEATYALTKLRLATEDVNYCIAKYNLENILPQNKALLEKQVLQATEEVRRAKADADNAITQGTILVENQKGAVKQNTLLDGEIANIPLKKDLLTKQVAGAQSQIDQTTKQIELLDTQIDMAPLQKKLLGEQVEVQRAQTSDSRTDGLPVVGNLGKQKDLYAQQITSYQRDAEVKAAKIWIDAWTVMKTIDEGLSPPTNFQNTTLDAILTSLKTKNGI